MDAGIILHENFFLRQKLNERLDKYHKSDFNWFIIIGHHVIPQTKLTGFFLHIYLKGSLYDIFQIIFILKLL